MKSLLPRGYTLDDLLKADPLASLYREITIVLDAHRKAHAKDDAAVSKLFKQVHALVKEKPELRGKWAEHGIDTSRGRRALVPLFGVSEKELLQVKKFQDGARRAKDRVVSNAVLIRSWRALKQRAKIKDIGEKDFPKTFGRPMLVLYSADWCAPCRIMRPTFARLVPFFDKAEVRYCHEEDWGWRQSQGVNGIPQFVAYFPNGARVNSSVGSTTKEVWDTMNKLITLGMSWGGEGELRCTEESCAIVPKEKQKQ